MIEAVTDLPAGILGFRGSGRITSDEYRQMMEPIYAALERGEKLNIYFELADDFHLEAGALWEDLKAAGSVGLKQRSSWQRMALVTDNEWVRHGASAFGWLTRASYVSSIRPSEAKLARGSARPPPPRTHPGRALSGLSWGSPRVIPEAALEKSEGVFAR